MRDGEKLQPSASATDNYDQVYSLDEEYHAPTRNLARRRNYHACPNSREAVNPTSVQIIRSKHLRD